MQLIHKDLKEQLSKNQILIFFDYEFFNNDLDFYFKISNKNINQKEDLLQNVIRILQNHYNKSLTNFKKSETKQINFMHIHISFVKKS